MYFDEIKRSKWVPDLHDRLKVLKKLILRFWTIFNCQIQDFWFFLAHIGSLIAKTEFLNTWCSSSYRIIMILNHDFGRPRQPQGKNVACGILNQLNICRTNMTMKNGFSVRAIVSIRFLKNLTTRSSTK